MIRKSKSWCYNLKTSEKGEKAETPIEWPILFFTPYSQPININANADEQNKFEVHILNNVAKMTNYLPKIGQDATFVQTVNGHNSTTPK